MKEGERKKKRADGKVDRNLEIMFFTDKKLLSSKFQRKKKFLMNSNYCPKHNLVYKQLFHSKNS